MTLAVRLSLARSGKGWKQWRESVGTCSGMRYGVAEFGQQMWGWRGRDTISFSPHPPCHQACTVVDSPWLLILGSQMLLPWQLQTGRLQVYPLLSLPNPRSEARSVPAQTFSSNFVHSSEKFLFCWTLPRSTKTVLATDHCSPGHCIYPREFSDKPPSSCWRQRIPP